MLLGKSQGNRETSQLLSWNPRLHRRSQTKRQQRIRHMKVNITLATTVIIGKPIDKLAHILDPCLKNDKKQMMHDYRLALNNLKLPIKWPIPNENKRCTQAFRRGRASSNHIQTDSKVKVMVARNLRKPKNSKTSYSFKTKPTQTHTRLNLRIRVTWVETRRK